MNPPPILGGQGRSDRECRDSANVLAGLILVAVVLLILLALWGR